MRFFAMLLLFAWSAPATAQDTRERYDYSVGWGYSDVARVTLRRGCLADGYVAASLTAKSLGVVDQLHAFRIRLDSFVAPTGRTLEGRTFVEEEGVPRRYRTRFAADRKAVAQKTYRKKETVLKLELRGDTFDLLSWFFALRSTSMAKGAVHRFDVWDGWKLTRVVATVGEIERVWTPAGTFDARRVSVVRTRLHHGGAKMYQPKAATETVGEVWFSTDQARTPVAMDLRAPVGLAKLRLSNASTARCGR